MEVIRVSTEHHLLSSRDQTQNQAKTWRQSWQGKLGKQEILEKTSVFVWRGVTNYLLTDGDTATGSNQSTEG